LTEALQTGGEVRNIGLALGPGRIVIRLEVGSVAANPQAAWSAFFSTPPDRLGGRD
jgi:hypothetical protein